MYDIFPSRRPPAWTRTGPPLTEATAEEHLAARAFATGAPGFVGAEVQLLPRRANAGAGRRVPYARLAAAVAAATPKLRHGRLSVEAGGAIEVSSPPSPGIDSCLDRIAEDLAVVREALRGAGLTTMNTALDPFRSPRRLVDTPRYTAMERYLDRDNPAGRWAMCSTAAVKVHLDAGHDDEADAAGLGLRRRWELAHALGPVLVAAFANSPLGAGRITGWRSTRQAIWQRLDRSRPAPPAGVDPRAVWAWYALDADVMYVREAGHRWTVPRGLTFRRWIASGGHQLRRPTPDDLDHHVGTLFPPVRPRGHLELRMIDGQSTRAWPVPVAVTAALFGDARAADEASTALEPLRAVAGLWETAARVGLAEPLLARVALDCFLIAYDALARQNVSRPVRDAVAEFIEAYVSRCRCPADDLLETVDDFA